MYRYDLFAITVSLAMISLFMDILFKPGLIVFSDIDFPFNSATYLEEIIGLWNNKWNTTSMLNIPRIFVVLPSYILSMIFESKGSVFLKMFIWQQLSIGAISMYYLIKELVIVYLNKHFDFSKTFSLIFGAILYALNPYVLFRIQHIYLLVGYSIFPLIIIQFLRIFDHKFQKIKIKSFSPYHHKLYPENYRDIAILAILITYASAAIHYFFYSFIALGIMFILLMIKYSVVFSKLGYGRLKKVILNMLKKLVLLGSLFLGLSFFWLSIYIGSIVFDVAATQHNINVIDTYTMFSKNSSWINVAYMISYWWPMFELSKLSISFYIGGAMVGAYIAIGIIFNSIKKHVILLMTIVGALAFVFSTGVQYDGITKVFLALCELPVFGNVFRDPNKLVGIMAVSYSVLFSFGIESVIEFTKENRWAKYGIFFIAAIGLYMYIMPMKYNFVEKYYAPVEEPYEYQDLRAYYEGDWSTNEYAIYMPLAETMLRPIYNRSTPKWNVVGQEDTIKATGDIHIYSTPVPTLFHHEGNAPSITHYFKYLQTLIDQGRTQNMRSYIKALGGTDYIYHEEYLDLVRRQEYNKTVLEYQREMNIKYANDIFTIYEIQKDIKERDEQNAMVKNMIWTPYGLTKYESYFGLKGYDVVETPVIFTSQNQIDVSKQNFTNQIIDVQFVDDFYLSNVPQNFRVNPFDWVDEINAFLKWSKTYTSNYDWSWYLDSQNIINRDFEFDEGAGLAVTFASGKLNVKPNKKDEIEGELVLDFDTMLRTDTFFEPDNPTLFDVKANPYKTSETIGVIQGVLKKGEPNNIWQVAKSKLIRAYEDTPYLFNIVISGRSVNKMHIKTRFFDENYKEIGVQYVVAPEEVIDFETVDFKGETVSPKGTKYMRLDLLSFQRPETKSYWWVHDVNIYDLSNYKSENKISGKREIETAGVYRVYIKSFKSIASGQLEIGVGSLRAIIDNKDVFKSGFQWKDLGEVYLEKGEAELYINNVQGFNAVNQMIIIPANRDKILKSEASKMIAESYQLITFEGEKDFIYSGNIQTRRTYTNMSLGMGLGISKGKLEGKFEIAEANYYYIDTSLFYPDEKKGSVRIKIMNQRNKTFYDGIDDRKAITAKDSILTSEYDPINFEYPYEKLDQDFPYRYVNGGQKRVWLEGGKYTLTIEIDSDASNMIGIENLKKFDPSIIKVNRTLEDVETVECSECEKITPDMFRSKIKGNEMAINYDPTCSCDWYIYSSEKLNINPLDQLLIRFQAKSKYIRERHTKMVFLDQFDHVLDAKFIFEVEEEKKDVWNTYEQLVTVPSDAHKVMYQIWARGDKTRMGTMEIKDLRVESYNDFIVLDSVVISEKESYEVPILENGSHVMDIQETRMGFEKEMISETNEEVLWNSYISPSKLWRIDGQKAEYMLNSVTMGYRVKPGIFSGSVVLSKVYYFGVILHFMTLVIIIIVLGYIYRNRR